MPPEELSSRRLVRAEHLYDDAPVRSYCNVITSNQGCILTSGLSESAASRGLRPGARPVHAIKNVGDMRESPSLKLTERIEARGARVDYFDPHVPVIPATREHAALAGRRSVDCTAATLADYDAVLVATDHDTVDYRLIAEGASVVVDTRNVFQRVGIHSDRIVKA
jgi:UDP-glucose/GDP-mannose dehydrogenase family, UDP binding domain